MPEFSQDWISWSWPTWKKHIPRMDAIRVLEVGCFEGRSTCWFMDTYPGSLITCLDTFEGGLDHQQCGLDLGGLEKRFKENTARYGVRVMTRIGKSYDGLIWCHNRHYSFEVALIDGSHVATDVISDIALAWPLLNVGGILILDDYEWGGDRPAIETPKPAIDAFLACYAGRYEVLEKGYQVIVRKLS